MQYENRQAPEGINVTPHNPFLHFLKLLAVVLVIIALVLVLVNLAGSRLARTVPFEYEQKLMGLVDHDFAEGSDGVKVNGDGSSEMQAYLNELARKIGANLPVPDGIDITVHYNADNVFNAFATLGGNVVFYRELLSRMPHENALAMVVAHELAHVVHRDPIAGIGSTLASVIAMGQMTGFGSDASSRLLKIPGVLTGLSFSRDMESAADRAALTAMAKTYGHVAGADELFKIFHRERERRGGDPASWGGSFVSTHPQDLDRVDAIARMAKENDWAMEGELTRLPALYYSWMASMQ